MNAILRQETGHLPRRPKPKSILIATGIIVASLMACYGPNAYRIWRDITYIGSRHVAANLLLAEQARDIDAVATCDAKAQGATAGDQQRRLDGVANCLVAHAPKLQTSQGLRFAAKTLAILKRDPAEQSQLLRRADAISKSDAWLSAGTCRAAVNMQHFWTPWFLRAADSTTIHCE